MLMRKTLIERLPTPEEAFSDPGVMADLEYFARKMITCLAIPNSYISTLNNTVRVYKDQSIKPFTLDEIDS